MKGGATAPERWRGLDEIITMLLDRRASGMVRLDVSVLVAGQEVARSAACGHGPHGLELSSPVSGITKVTVDGSVG